MSRRGAGAKKKVKSETGAAVAAALAAPAAASSPAASPNGNGGAAAAASGGGAAAPSKRVRRVAEVVYPPGRTAVMWSTLSPAVPMLAFDAALLLDKGFAPTRWACARLAEEALYLETRAAWFELLGEGAGYVLSRLREATQGPVPAAEEAKEVVGRADSWQGVLWRPDGVAVGGAVLSGVVALRWERFTGVAYV